MRLAPLDDGNPIDGLIGARAIHIGSQLAETRQLIDDQPDSNMPLHFQLARQPPAHTDVAEIIDDPAKNIAGQPRKIQDRFAEIGSARAKSVEPERGDGLTRRLIIGTTCNTRRRCGK